MVSRIRAHFDGKVFVPDEPVDLPVGQPLELDVHRTGSGEAAPSEAAAQALADRIERLEPLPTDTLPRDLAAAHDHYLYGTPKR